MPTEARKGVVAKFPLRLMPSVKQTAEVFSRKEGVSLNQFINLAVAEKLAHLQHEEWDRNRKKPTPELIARAMAILDRAGTDTPEPGDELPKGYRRKK